MKIKKLTIVLIVVGIIVIAGGIVLMNNSSQTEDSNSYNPQKTGMGGVVKEMLKVNEKFLTKRSNIDIPIKLSLPETLILIGAVMLTIGIIWNFVDLSSSPPPKIGNIPNTR